MKEKKNRSQIWRGLTSTASVLLVVAIAGTQTALTYTGTLNSYLGTTTSKVVQAEGEEKTTYYESEFGEFSAENLQTLIQATYDESVAEEEEGAVLLRNEQEALPLASDSHVTLFGHAVAQPVYKPGGAGTSAAETGTYVVSLYDALKNVGFAVNDELYKAYENSDTERVASNNLMIGGGPNDTGDFNPEPVLGEEPASFYTDELKSSWENDYNDVAIVMLAREGGEDKEIMMEDPQGNNALSLYQDEKDMLQMIQDSGKFEKVVVLLNSAFQMEVDWMDDYGVDACLWIGNPGQRGFEGVANLLTGAANPSGRLVDTYATSSMSSPAAHTSSQNTTTWTNMDEIIEAGIVTDKQFNIEHVVVQSEGIYVGYKYYETRYEDAVSNDASGATAAVGSSTGSSWNYADEVVYPFGYGLSYTSFEQTLDSVTYDEASDTFEVKATVTNTGDTAGMSAVQLYVQTPYGDYEKENLVEKSAIQVIGYDKTDVLEPGASETVTISVDRYLMASYDYTNAEGYILSAGDYYFAIGDDSHDALNNVMAAKGVNGLVDQEGNAVSGNAQKTYSWNYAEVDTETYRNSDTGEEVTNQFEDADLNYWVEDGVTYLTRQDWAGTFPETPVEVACSEEMMNVLQGDLYEKPEDAPEVSDFTQGENSNLTLAAMKDVDYDDDEKWDTYLNQMTIEELASQISDMFGTAEVTSVGKTNFTTGDGTASVGANTFPEQYGDTRDVCLYPSSVVVSCTWNPDRLERRGQLMADEALYCELPYVFTGGGNLHRTPYGGRNAEYYSEDSIKVYLDSVTQLTEMEKKGVAAGIKHVSGNDQELYREGLNLFFNEQAFREGSLKACEGVLTNDRTTCLMHAFNRLGLIWTSSSSALCTQVIRNEWGFKGMEETDGVVGAAYKNHFTTSLAAGVSVYCIDPLGDSSAAILTAINDHDDGYVLQLLRGAVKNYHYTLSRTNAINGMSTNATIESVMPWWEIALYALDVVLAALVALAAFMMYRGRKSVVSEVVTEKKEGGENNEA